MSLTYCTISELRSWIGSDISANDVLLDTCIEAASRDIDGYCKRRFWQDTNASARLFFGTDPYTADIDDVATTSGLVVKTGPDNTGTYGTTWTLNSDFLLEPHNQTNSGLEGWPFVRLRAVGSKSFAARSGPADRPSLQVTAKWGWPAVPDPVRHACLIHANWLFFQRNAPSGSAQVGEFAIRLRQSTAATLLGPYVRVLDPAIGPK